jgi:hypothetical protein
MLSPSKIGIFFYSIVLFMLFLSYSIILCIYCFVISSSVAVHGIESDIPVPLIGEPEKPSAEDEFLILHPKRTVAELINNNEEGLFSVCAEIIGVVSGADWWYPACKCHKSVITDSGSYFCDGCGRHVFQVVPRYFEYINIDCFILIYCSIFLKYNLIWFHFGFQV